MNKQSHFFSLILLSNYLFYCAAVTGQAWIKVPVCDLIGDSYAAADHHNGLVNYYNNLPLCWGQRIIDCPRIHQLLYNEEVTILEEKGDECLVKIPSIFYESANSSERFNTFWTLKKNLITRQTIAKLGISRNIFPDALNFQAINVPKVQKKTAVLCLPFTDPKTKLTYSAGTRFVVTEKQNNQGTTVYIFDAQHNKCVTTIIPQKLCRIETKNEPLKKRIDNFVALLRLWTRQDGFIPYVWGGSSFTLLCKNDVFELSESNNSAYYTRPSYQETPKKGFDCAGLIARAAQICGLPYYFKNSVTIKKNLSPITDATKIQEGDILWIKGHVMIVANIKNNTLIEARGYDDGYGKIHEIALSKVLQGIQNFNQLLDHYKAKKTIYRLNNKGIVTGQFDTFALLSLESAFV